LSSDRARAEPALLLSFSDVVRLLDMAECIEAIERAFGASAGAPIASGILGLSAAWGGFHIKACLLPNHPARATGYFAAKVNANFPGNPTAHGLPTIQGVLTLFDATTGVPLAVMDSIAVSIIRTAAATAVAARHLSRPDSSTVTIVGCGAQANAQLQAIALVRPIARAFAVDTAPGLAESFARNATDRLGFPVTASGSLHEATSGSDIIVTCTPSRKAYLGPEHVSPGAFVAAVGADNEHKQELEPSLMAASAVVTDSTAQCASIGDLHHAIESGAMTIADVRAELAVVVADPVRGRRDANEVVIYDSTGVAFQDVVASALVYERAIRDGQGTGFRFWG
jgi:ornithine cyclodeaminase/alanine dehydrogenase-like protein (mu-crystallin family)